jgi:putative Holliday junction resolvase
MRTGRRVAFDIGKARIGVAVSDFHAILASPRDHILRRESDSDTITELISVVQAEDPIEVYVGLPVNLKNESTASTEDAVSIAKQLSQVIAIPIRLIDERLSSKVASSSLQASGKDTRSQRSYIDSAAAAVILEAALSAEKNSGNQPGLAVEGYQSNE